MTRYAYELVFKITLATDLGPARGAFASFPSAEGSKVTQVGQFDSVRRLLGKARREANSARPNLPTTFAL